MDGSDSPVSSPSSYGTPSSTDIPLSRQGIKEEISVNKFDSNESSSSSSSSTVWYGSLEEEDGIDALGLDPSTAIISEADSTTLTQVQNEDFSDIASHGIVEVVGDDVYGRKIIILAASKLPSNRTFDHQKFLRYLLCTLDKYVEQDYSLVYFHHGLNSTNKPSISWLWQAFRAFGRQYKKNLKALYLVHPTSLLKIIFRVFKPVVSAKFGRKIMYLNSLSELNQQIRLDQLCIPNAVHEHDAQLTAKVSKVSHNAQANPADTNGNRSPPPTQQFGVSLQFIKEHNGDDVIPPLLMQCVEYLSHDEALGTDGLFRRSASTKQVKEWREKANRGERVEFNGDFHLAAVLIKSFLRELEEPVLTFALFNEITEFQNLAKEEQGSFVKQVLEKLPEDNYTVLKYLIQFLVKVKDRADRNKMTASNLALVFGPNLLWSENLTLSLSAIAPINMLTEYILSHHEEVLY